MPITNEDGDGSENDGEVVVAPGHIAKLLEAGQIEDIQGFAEEGYSFTTEEFDLLIAHFRTLITPPQISPLTKPTEQLKDYLYRVQSPVAIALCNIFACILPRLDAEATNHFIQSSFDELIAISTFGGSNISELVIPSKIDTATCDFLKQQVFALFKQYSSQPDTLKSDKTLAVINHLIDNFILSSAHLLNKSPVSLGKDLLSWLQLMHKSPGESLSRSGGTASKVAALCYKLGEKADLGITDNESNNALHFLMQSKLPIEDVNKLTSLFLKRGVSCHRHNHKQKSPLRYAMADLSFGPGVIDIMFREGKIPVQYLHNMLTKAREGEVYAPYILQIVDALSLRKSVSNKEIQELIAWIVKNSSAENSSHPSYGYRKDLFVLINHLLDDPNWNNFGLDVDQICVWEELSADECAEQISKLKSIAGILPAFVINANLHHKLPAMLNSLEIFIFSDKEKSKQGILPVQFLSFIAQNPQHIQIKSTIFESGFFDTQSSTRQFLLLNAATRDAGDAPFAKAVENFNSKFINFVLSVYQQTDQAANDFAPIANVLASRLQSLVVSLSSSTQENCERFFGIEDLLNDHLANAMMSQFEKTLSGPEIMDTALARRVTPVKLNTLPTSFLHLAFRINAAYPRDSQHDSLRMEEILTRQVMRLVEVLSDANESELAQLHSLMSFLHSKSHAKFLEGAIDYFDFTTFEGNLHSQLKDTILAQHGKNQFMLSNLGLATPITTKVVPSPIADAEDVVLINTKPAEEDSATAKNTFLGFGLFSKARSKWNDLVDTAAKESPVFAKLLLNRQDETSSERNTTPSIVKF